MSSGLVDFHNHVMPGVDDGALDPEQSAEALRAMSSHGIQTVVATPHVDCALAIRPGVMEDRLDVLDRGWQALQDLAREQFPDMEVRRGAELKLSIPEPDLSDSRLRLDGGRFVLVEFASMAVPPRSDVLLHGIVAGGFVPILAHPERYSGLKPDSRLVRRWKEIGVLLQVNAGSLSGRYGQDAQRSALCLLRLGLADYMCSDYHARGRPAVEGAKRVMAREDAAEQFELLTSLNPSRMLRDELPLAVEPLRTPTGWRALIERLRA